MSKHRMPLTLLAFLTILLSVASFQPAQAKAFHKPGTEANLGDPDTPDGPGRGRRAAMAPVTIRIVGQIVLANLRALPLRF